VTSLADLGRLVTMAEADAALKAAFETTFGPTYEALQTTRLTPEADTDADPWRSALR
jgi:hypothetical protein